MMAQLKPYKTLVRVLGVRRTLKLERGHNQQNNQSLCLWQELGFPPLRWCGSLGMLRDDSRCAIWALNAWVHRQVGTGNQCSLAICIMELGQETLGK
jgi:hypothetical protein